MNDEPRANILSTDTEALPDYLKRRERELIQQTAALRGMLVPKEKELAAVRQAMQAVGIQPSYAADLVPFLDDKGQHRVIQTGTVTVPMNLVVNGTIVNLTIKEMVLAALKDHFHAGATPAELRDYFRAVYGRDVDRASISPQLARLRDNGMIDQSPEGFWRLPKSADKKQVKEMVVQALLNRLQGGATAAALRDFIHEEYGRQVEISNLLRQLHSLREGDILVHNLGKDTWNLEGKKRNAFMMSEGAELQKAMRQLRDDDDPPEADFSDSPLLKAAAKMPWEDKK